VNTSQYLYPDGDALTDVLAWATSRMQVFDPGFGGFRPEARAIAHAAGSTLRGAAVYELFSAVDCMVHVVSDGSTRWVTREFCVRAMAFPFIQLRQRRITCMVSEMNQPSLAFTRGFGWTEEGRMRKAGPQGEDVVLFGMLAEECRWLNTALFPASRVANSANPA
jgi:hypothetical protein